MQRCWLLAAKSGYELPQPPQPKYYVEIRQGGWLRCCGWFHCFKVVISCACGGRIAGEPRSFSTETTQLQYPLAISPPSLPPAAGVLCTDDRLVDSLGEGGNGRGANLQRLVVQPSVRIPCTFAFAVGPPSCPSS